MLIGGGAGIGLVVAVFAWPRHLSSDLKMHQNEEAFGNFIKIARDGRITIAVAQSETGQGIWTGLPQIVADELGASWDFVAVEPAPLTAAYANALANEEGWLDGFGWLRSHRVEDDGRLRITAGSTSVRAFEQPLRKAAAVARTMLVGAAADRWAVNPSDCDTGDGFVMNRGRTFTFGELAEEAADRTPPLSASFKESSEGRLIGKPLARLDGPAKVDGSWRFAADVRLEDMLFASVRVAPPGARLVHFKRQAIEGVHGIRHIASGADWLAVVATNWWAAERGAHSADPEFSGQRDPADLRHLFEDALARGDRRSYRRGDYEGTVRGSRPLAATYFVAPAQHLGLEPLSATARFTGNRLEVWVPTQAPGLSRDAAALAARIPSSDVTLYPMAVGEPAGRALEPDAMPYAIMLARQLGRPVQATLSQSATQNHDLVSSGALARMMALPGEDGITAAWKMEVASVDGMGSALRRMLDIQDKRELIRTSTSALPPYAIPNVTIEATSPALPYRTGYMRGSPFREFAFFTESFADELAHAAGLEPLSFRMSLLGDNGRLARCLQGAARLAKWDGGAPGSTMGIAGCSAYGSHIGLVANASIGSDQMVKVDRLVAAVDCGQIVNRSLVEQQIEAGLLWGLAQASVAKPEWVAGMPRARPIGAMGLPRLSAIPQIEVEIIPSSDSPGGVSGLGTSVLAPAVANAVFAATGKRMRELPFDPMTRA
ncbi:MAG TPA: molybdopterin cofactor-binding domain-containing protein [Sphingomicrobium sp.]|nr:molybdopterin cofactor-binding domain-containing protein [Sphingomicrobium sp.]